MGKNLIDQALNGNWLNFVKVLPHMSEEDCRSALSHERNNDNRKEYVFRLHRKYTRLRYKREQKELGVL